MVLLTIALALQAIGSAAQAVPAPPEPESFDIVELPLPPASSSKEEGACTASINPRGTGCIAQDFGDHLFQAGDFTPDASAVIVNVEFVGAPAAPDPASIYSGEQLILVKADGTKFPNGDPWKCLSCAVPAEQKLSLDPEKDYPHVFRSGEKAIWGHNIVDCGGHQLGSDSCTPNRTHIYPIHWPVSADGSGSGGTPREMRVHPDDKHIGWSSFDNAGGQNCFLGRLEFNANPTFGEPRVPRYDLVDVNLLLDPTRRQRITANGSELTINSDTIGVGELRGFSGDGAEITYIGPSTESTNIDVYAVHIETGAVRRLTSHPEYTDPLSFSHDNEWFVAMDTRGTNRQMWMSGMRAVPPIIDIVAVTIASSTRNNGARRFFQPILIDWHGDRDDYYGQRINSEGSGENGSVNDANWNGRADPAFSHDGTKIVYWQTLVTAPSCGGANPLPCPDSTAQGGRHYRIMLARRTDREPTAPAPVFNVPKQVPWATAFPPGTSIPSPGSRALVPGNYTLQGKASGHADVRLMGGSSINRVAVNYTDYSDDGKHFLNGYEDVLATILLPNIWNNQIDWYSDIVQTGAVSASKTTSPGGFHLVMDIGVNWFNATGELTTVVDGVEYKQPANGT